MKKLVFSLMVLALVSTACKKSSETQENKAQEVVLTEFSEQAPNLVGKEIAVMGTVTHTCKHGGGKMFITAGEGEDAANLKIVATDESGKFNVDMEGNDYIVIGEVDEYRLDNAKLDEMEAKMQENQAAEEQDEKGKECKEGKADEAEEHHLEKKKLENLREKVKNSEKGYLSFYSVNAKVVKPVNKK